MSAKATRSASVGANPGEISLTEAAKRLAMSHQGAGQWAAKMGAPVRKTGARVYVAWPAFLEFYVEGRCKSAVEEATKKLRAQLEAATGDGTGDPGRRLLEANARKAEIEVAELEARKVDVSDAEAVVEKVFTDLRSQLIPFPRTAAPKLLGAKSLQELEARLDTEIHRLMETLAQPIELGGTEQDKAT